MCRAAADQKMGANGKLEILPGVSKLRQRQVGGGGLVQRLGCRVEIYGQLPYNRVDLVGLIPYGGGKFLMDVQVQADPKTAAAGLATRQPMPASTGEEATGTAMIAPM